MAIVMPSLLAPIRQEASNLLRYSRTHPRFTLHLVMDAILSIALAIAIFQISNADSRHNISAVLKTSGAVALSASDLRALVDEEHLKAYWIGPKADDKYTLVATTPGEVTISYFPKNADIHDVGASVLVVQTDKHLGASQAQAYSQQVSGPGSFQMSQGAAGNVIEYNPAAPEEVLVMIKGQSSTVTIFDSTPGNPLEMAMKAGVIQKIA